VAYALSFLKRVTPTRTRKQNERNMGSVCDTKNIEKKTVKIREGSPDSRSKWLGLSNKM